MAIGQIAHLKMKCVHCEKWTSVYVVETGTRTAPEVKCEHCKKIFEFRAGMMYDPVGYVSSIPSWARIDNHLKPTQEEKAAIAKSKKSWWKFW